MNQKYTIEIIKDKFKEGGYKCTSKRYINNSTPLEYICPKGHNGQISLKNWDHGYRCPLCAGVRRHTIKFIRSEFERKGWKLTSTEYVNAFTKLDYICPNGHCGSIKWNNWQQGSGCLECAGNKKLTIEFVKSEFEKEGWECTSNEYVNNNTLLNYICPNGHYGVIRWTDWKQGHRCPKCSMNGTSLWESIIKQFVSTINENFIGNDRTQIINPDTDRYLELDLWFPDLNKAIECNGSYWHSKKDRKDIDKLKQEWCKNNNISLLVVTDTEWNKDIKKCQKKIEKFLN